jgi:hypothetical protein
MRRQPAVVQDLIPVGIPREIYEDYKHVMLHLDFFYVNNLIVEEVVTPVGVLP